MHLLCTQSEAHRLKCLNTSSCFDWLWHYCIVNQSKLCSEPCFYPSVFSSSFVIPPPFWYYYNVPCFLFASVCLCTSWVVCHPQAPLQSANYLLSLHPTLNCLQAPQLGLSCSGVSRRCSCLTFRIPYFYTLSGGGRREYSPARRLCGPFTCLFIYRQWPIAGVGLCQHLGTSSCYYWPHTYAYTNL